MQSIVRDFRFHFVGPNRYKRLIKSYDDPMQYVGRANEDTEAPLETNKANCMCHVRWAFLSPIISEFPDIEERFFNGRHMLIVSELHDNPGQSITSSWEVLLTQLEGYLQIKAGSFAAIEHYGEFSYNDPARDETFSRVSFRRSVEKADPMGQYAINGWEPLDPKHIANVLDQPSIDEVDWPFKS